MQRRIISFCNVPEARLRLYLVKYPLSDTSQRQRKAFFGYCSRRLPLLVSVLRAFAPGFFCGCHFAAASARAEIRSCQRGTQWEIRLICTAPTGSPPTGIPSEFAGLLRIEGYPARHSSPA